jgi:hypothetical protein
MGDIMSKPNFCNREVLYTCRVKLEGAYSKCKFYKRYSNKVGEYTEVGCDHLVDGECLNERAWKDAEEKQRAAAYSNKKLTA